MVKGKVVLLSYGGSPGPPPPPEDTVRVSLNPERSKTLRLVFRYE